ncbi:MAG: hypothetical protein ACI80H_001543, partial [Pseudoalteromonas distincta]
KRILIFDCGDKIKRLKYLYSSLSKMFVTRNSINKKLHEALPKGFLFYLYLRRGQHCHGQFWVR